MKIICTLLIISLLTACCSCTPKKSNERSSKTTKSSLEPKNSKNEETTQVLNFKIKGMTCAGCEAMVQKAAESVPGIKSAKASFEGKICSLQCQGKVDINAIREAVSKAGFKATLLSEKQKKGKTDGNK